MLAEHKKCVPLSGYISQAGLACCQLNTDILSGPDASLTSSLLSVTFGGTTTVEVLATKLKHQSSLNNSPSDKSMVYCHPGKHSTVPFGNTFNYLGQRKKSSIHGRINHYRFHYYISLLLEDWVEYFFHLSSYKHRQRHPSRLPVTGILVEQPSVLQSEAWARVGWTQLLDNCKTQVSRCAHAPSHSSAKALLVLNPCRSTHIFENLVVQLRKQWQQRSSTPATYWNCHHTEASVLGQKEGPSSLCLDSIHSWRWCLHRSKSMANKTALPSQ